MKTREWFFLYYRNPRLPRPECGHYEPIVLRNLRKMGSICILSMSRAVDDERDLSSLARVTRYDGSSIMRTPRSGPRRRR